MVAVPTLLLNEAQVHDLVLDLEIRFLANRDRNLLLRPVDGSPDSDHPDDQHDALVELCTRLIEGLNVRYRSEAARPSSCSIAIVSITRRRAAGWAGSASGASCST
jgi:cyclic beta-1,2-glucan synthetase